jgi:Fe2+ or Zn2+ uptake regulation protein
MIKPSTKHQADISKLFFDRGLLYTAQRRAVWEFFARYPHGHTIAETIEALQTRHIGQATVYRTIFLFFDLGILRRLQSDADGKTYFVAVSPGHTHPLICRTCHAIVDFDVCDLSLLENMLSRETGYAIERHHLEIYGLCPTCQGNTCVSDGEHR